MTNSKTTKRALFSSVIALILCFAMLLGTTFAWFTDCVSTGLNQIIAGNLDVELEYTTDFSTWNSVEGKTELVDPNALWEPGHTEVVYLRIRNAGTLALKYRFSMNIISETTATNVYDDPFKLSTYLKYGVVEGQNAAFADRSAARAAAETVAQNLAGYTEVGEMAAGEHDRFFALVVYMPETVGNEANYKTGTTVPKIELGLNLVATQYTNESDSFDNQYDLGANYYGDYMRFDSATVTPGAQNEPLEIILTNNAPVSDEKSTALNMETVPVTFVDKEVKFSSTAYNAPAAQNSFSIATGDNIEVAALKLDLTVDGAAVHNLGGTATITTYIQTGLSSVSVTYVAENNTTEPISEENITYDPVTGKLTFKTNHLSDYVVTAKCLSEENGAYVIKNAGDLYNFANMVNKKGYNFSTKNVRLENDIDLENAVWTPIGQTGSTTFHGTFNGQGHTIKNMVVNNTDTSANCASGFFGWIEDNSVVISNVKFENASVTGNHNVGVVAGWISGSINNCEVKNSTVVANNANDDANGDKVGGVVGYVNAGSIEGNTVTSCSISGNRDIGGIAGAVISGVSFTQNSISDTNIVYETDKTYASAGEIVSGRTGFAPDATNTATNVTIIHQITVSTAAELSAALNTTYNSDITIKLANNIDLSGSEWGANRMLVGANVNVTVDGNGKTISGLTTSTTTNLNGFISNGLVAAVKADAPTGSLTFKNLTVANATVTNNEAYNSAAGVFVGDAQSICLNFENCKVVNANVTSAAYAAGFVGYFTNHNDGDNYITISNCEVTNSSFTGNDATGALVALSNQCVTINGATVTGNTIDGGAGYSAAALVGTSIGGTTATNVTVNDNTFNITGNNYQANSSSYGYVYMNGQTYSVNGSVVI